MSDCLFCKISRSEIPAKIVHEDEHVLVFHDIAPTAPTHLLVIPREHISTVNDLEDANAGVIGKMFLAAKTAAREAGLSDAGYRLVMNVGEGGGQTVFHIHLHVIGGRSLSWPPG